MNALIAESSGVAVKPGLRQTIEAVRFATEGLPSEDGANAQAIGKHLKLDKSAARRRLLAAVSEGFVKNLETRRGQPGRYQLTGQKIEIAEMLPPPESLPPCHRTGKGQAIEMHSGCAAGGTVTRHEEYEERAAIREFDGGHSRAEAEVAAWQETVGEMPEFLRRTA